MKSVSDYPHHEAELELLAAIRDGILPDARLSLTEWADTYRQLSPLSSSEPGQWKTARVPYLREPMDALSTGSDVTEVVLMWAAQLAKTEMLNNLLGYIASEAPGPVMYVLPTVDLAKRTSRQRVAPMFDETPRLQGLLRDPSKRDSGNNRLEKLFPGGILILTGANSAAGLRSMPVRYVLMDEVDAYPINVEGEGDPLALAEARTRNFHNHKIVKCSTPTFADSSRIEKAAELGDMCRYEIPCPHCAFFQVLVWSHLRWDKGQPETAKYACDNCGVLIEERHKTRMLAAGRWVKTNPKARPGVRSFLLSSLYSPLGWYSWAQAAREWEDSAQDIEKRRAFTNTVLGETWKEQAEVPSYERLYNRREDYPRGIVPHGALVITAGVDVQKDRLEVEIVGWGRGLESWSIDHFVLAGNPIEPGVWQDLDKVLDRQWKHAGGALLPIRMMAVDTGYQPDAVYGWVRTKSRRQVIAVRGQPNLPVFVAQPTAVDVSEAGKKRRRGVQLWPLGVGLIKSQVYAWLNIEQPAGEGVKMPPGFCHFPRYDLEYFEQLTAEKFVTRALAGKRRRVVAYWDKIRPRNEMLDCRVYARGAAVVAGLDRWQEAHWHDVEVALGLVRPTAAVQDDPRTPTQAAPPTEPPPDRPRPGGFLTRWRTR